MAFGQPTTILHPYVLAQGAVESEAWGARSTLLDGTDYPRPAFYTFGGKSVAGGKENRGYWHRFRTICPAAFRPDWLKQLAWFDDDVPNGEGLVFDAGAFGPELSSSSVGNDPRLFRLFTNYQVSGADAGKRRKGFTLNYSLPTPPAAPATLYHYQDVLNSQNYSVWNSTLYHTITAVSGESSAWDNEEHITFLGYDVTGTIVWSNSRRRVMSGTTAYLYEIAAPAGAPSLADNGAGAMAAGTYKYYVVFKSTTGRRSGPSPVATITQVASRQVALTSIGVSGDAQVTAREIYRTKAGGTIPYLLTTIGDNSTTTYNDNNADAALTLTTYLPFDAYGTFCTSTLPTMTRKDHVVIYKNMVVTADNRDLYHTPPGIFDRWSANNRIAIPCNNRILGLAVAGDALLVCTREEVFRVYGTGTYSTSESGIVSSDWRVERIPGYYGIIGPKHLRAVDALVFGFGNMGPWVFDGDLIRPMRKPPKYFYWNLSDYGGDGVPLGTNNGAIGYLSDRREVLICVKSDLGTENFVTFVYPLDEAGRLGVYDLALSYFPVSSPPTGGVHACDFWGNVINLDQFYEVDGAGTQALSGLTAVEPTPYAPNTIATLSGGNTVVTPTTGASGFATATDGNGLGTLRGVRVVFVPASGEDPPETRTIVSNTGSTITLGVALPSHIPVGSKMFIGGICGHRETVAFSPRISEGQVKEGAVRRVGAVMNDYVYDTTNAIYDVS